MATCLACGYKQPGSIKDTGEPREETRHYDDGFGDRDVTVFHCPECGAGPDQFKDDAVATMFG